LNRTRTLLADYGEIRFGFIASHVNILANFGDGGFCRHRLRFNDRALFVRPTNNPEAFAGEGGSRTSYNEGRGKRVS
jgi:hypothetical protein